jgi:metallo-beta-lactamase family protein
MSAHADSTEILRWLHGFAAAPKATFIVHGEVTAMQTLSARIDRELGWTHRMPEHRETVALE